MNALRWWTIGSWQRAFVLAWSLLLAGSCGSETGRSTSAELGVLEVDRPIIACETSLARSVTVDTVASGLDTPWDVAFLSDGTALFTERGGRIRSINPGGALDPVSWAVVPVIEDSERGLFGIDVLSAEDGQVAVYVAGTFQYLGGSRLSRVIRRVGRRIARAIDSERGHGTYLEVLRIPSMNRRAGVPESVVSGIPSAALHAGGALRFGPDGFLYVGTGEAMEGWSAQDLTTTRGKVLRYGSDGSIPLTNPYPGSPIFALGFRNVQGLDWHPSTQELFAVEHGPTGAEREGFRTDDDELNLIEPVRSPNFVALGL